MGHGETGLSRREWVAGVSAALGAGLAAGVSAPAAPARKERPKNEPFGYCLNMSTIAAQKQSLPEKIDLAARAGYDAIEPWVPHLDRYVKDGGSLKDVGKRIRDRGLAVPSLIGFPSWIVDDPRERKKGMEEVKRCMDVAQQIGAKRLAAPPAGATNKADLSLFKAAERYRALLDLGDKMQVVPELEVWGFSKAIGRLSEAVMVAMETGHPKACVLPDVFHLYKGGSPLNGLKLLGPQTLHVIHLNDYPARPPRDRINDSYRIYPGDGVAPLGQILRDLHGVGFRGYLSLELFNPTYYKQDALDVAKTGLAKMRTVVRASFGKK